MASGNAGFFKQINESEAGQLLSLAANSIQVFGGLYALISALTTESDTDQILAALDQLKQELDADFSALGDLIKQQIQLVIQNEDTIAMAAAIAHTNTATDKLARFATSHDAADISAADTESDLGVQFFLALPEAGEDPSVVSRTDPFFLPAVAKAGSVRILVIAGEDPNFRSVPDEVAQISSIAALLQGMIDQVKAAVNAAHTIQLKVLEIHTAHGMQVTYVGYYHEENLMPLQFFSSGSATVFTDPRVTNARNAAEAAREGGVAAELAFLGIPDYEELVKKWTSSLSSANAALAASMTNI